MLFLYDSEPLRCFLRWLNRKYPKTPPIGVKFTVLPDEMEGAFDLSTWTIWVDARLPYEHVTEVVGHEFAHCLQCMTNPETEVNDHGAEWQTIFDELKESWGEHVEAIADAQSRYLLRGDL